MLVLGIAVAVSIALLKPASENANPLYLVICGVAAMASMIIPGLSGSFVLLLMGNYFLVLRAVNERDFGMLVPVAIGAVLGLLTLSHLLAWVFRRHHNWAVSLLTGFVIGSLLVIWPWKKGITADVEIEGEMVSKVVAYQWQWPAMSAHTLAAVGLMVVGFVAVWLMEKAGGDRDAKKSAESES